MGGFPQAFDEAEACSTFGSEHGLLLSHQRGWMLQPTCEDLLTYMSTLFQSGSVLGGKVIQTSQA